jgi:hypothetical protein
VGTEVKRPSEEITGGEDLLDPRDIAERLKYLTRERDELESSQLEEIDALQEVVDEDIDDTLVHEDYFQEYAEELAVDIGAIDRSQRNHWPYTCIDWEQAAEELKQDYSVIDIRGGTYYYRS